MNNLPASTFSYRPYVEGDIKYIVIYDLKNTNRYLYKSNDNMKGDWKGLVYYLRNPNIANVFNLVMNTIDFTKTNYRHLYRTDNAIMFLSALIYEGFTEIDISDEMTTKLDASDGTLYGDEKAYIETNIKNILFTKVKSAVKIFKADSSIKDIHHAVTDTNVKAYMGKQISWKVSKMNTNVAFLQGITPDIIIKDEAQLLSNAIINNPTVFQDYMKNTATFDVSL
jgi:hypothetical protein